MDEGLFLLRFYGCFFAAVAATLAPCQLLGDALSPWSTGTAALACVVGWNLAFVSLVPRKSRLWQQWEFCALLSLMQPIPDMFLIKVLGTLVFDPSPLRIGGAVPAAMMGMWTIALIPVTHLATRFGGRSATKRAAFGALVSAVWFFGPEHLCVPLRLWHPTPKVQLKIGHVAVYVLVSEAAFGAAVVYTEQAVRGGSVGVIGRLCVACGVMLLYTGALAAAWLVLEVGVL